MDYGRSHLSPASTYEMVLFSYSLSMIPHFEAALECARRDLRPDGILVVLDFSGAGHRVIAGIMGSMGVELDERRRAAIDRRFRVVRDDDRRAWGGLWNYRLIVGVRIKHREARATVALHMTDEIAVGSRKEAGGDPPWVPLTTDAQRAGPQTAADEGPHCSIPDQPCAPLRPVSAGRSKRVLASGPFAPAPWP
jgi:hypothetical protein